MELSSVEHSFWWRKGLLEDLDGKISAVPEFQEAVVIGVDWSFLVGRERRSHD